TAVAAELQQVPLTRAPRSTLTIARIGGGESINSIPREGWLEVDVRSTSASVLDDIERTMRQLVARIEARENARRTDGSAALSAHIEQLGHRPCGSMRDDAPLVRIAEQATHAIGRTPRLATGSTDASVPISLGIPAIAIGAGGRGGGTHTPQEWYDDTHGSRGLQRALRIVAIAAGMR
ncbi:MAG TPA: M20/M25/M40 family metallo-hydrolase, partial [Gemmatimonadaceae bacterium]|nr:M20/M25/M40 family metallo-hydrolase [Gemmatimonadaceae bacterium]